MVAVQCCAHKSDLEVSTAGIDKLRQFLRSQVCNDQERKHVVTLTLVALREIRYDVGKHRCLLLVPVFSYVSIAGTRCNA